MCVQNGYNETKLFLHNGKENVANDDLNDIEEFRNRYTMLACTFFLPCFCVHFLYQLIIRLYRLVIFDIINDHETHQLCAE